MSFPGHKAPRKDMIINMKNPIMTMTLEDGRQLTAELFPEAAPETVRNFIHLANDKHFYDGLIFHRCIDGFMIQGGCPLGKGTGGPGWNIKGEFKANGLQNPIAHVPGVLSMARSAMPDSAGSQFFICTGECSHLDGQYAAFGKLIKGLETAIEISRTKTDRMDRPLTEQKIKEIRVDTFGQAFEEPKKL